MPAITTTGEAVVLRFAADELDQDEPTTQRLTAAEARLLATVLQNPSSRQQFVEQLQWAANDVAIQYPTATTTTTPEPDASDDD